MSIIRNKKRIVSFGCSLTWGQELSDNVFYKNGWGDDCLDLTKYSRHSYGALVADHFNMSYHSLAAPGGSNDAIERLLLDHIRSDNYYDDVFLIGWTSATRREYFVEGRINDYAGFLYRTNKPDAPEEMKLIQKAHDSIWDQMPDSEIFASYCRQVLRTQMIMQHLNIPYMMTRALRPMANAEAIMWEDLDFAIKDTDFFSWTHNQKHTRGQFNHPLEQAHRGWADKLIEQMK